MMNFWGRSDASRASDRSYYDDGDDDDESVPPPPPPHSAPSESVRSDKINQYEKSLAETDEFVEEDAIEHPIGAGPPKRKFCSTTRLFWVAVLLLLGAAAYLAVEMVDEFNESSSTSSSTGGGTTVSSSNAATNTECVNEVSIDKTCYEYGENITVSFTSCDATSLDWVGLRRLPDDDGNTTSTGTSNIFSDYKYREWTCGVPVDAEQDCDTGSPPSEGIVEIEAFVRPGLFQMYLGSGESSTSPYLAVSKIFTSADVCP